ncbi:multidrug resistance-associated protein 1-like isoform X3 [Planococcus citri]|uniref:multidrug resistance-associated protein 1-like isoform X3 n=1 Tax=Planococcus citri TaxID=170843 RepID=UPI0031F74585
MDLTEFCGSTFWDSNITWDTEYPDLTLCFEKTVLVWVPCAFLWLLLPLEWYYLRHSKTSDIPLNIYNVAKLIAIAILATLALTDIVHHVFLDYSYDPPSPVNFWTPSLKFVTFVLFFALTYANIRRGIRSSAVLFVFSFLLVAFGAPQYRTEFRLRWSAEKRHETMEFVSYVIYYPVAIMVLIMNCFADSRPRIVTYPIDKDVCPENQCSFLSRLLFAWFDAFAWKGYKKPLEDSDCWSLDYSNSSASIVPKFEKHWNKALEKVKKSPDVEIRVRRENGELLRNGGEDVGGISYKVNKSTKYASIVPALCRTFGGTFALGTILKVFQDVLTFVSPQILSLLIDFTGGKEYMWRGYMYAIALFLVAFVQTLLLSQYFHRMYIVGLRVRTCLVSIIYKKALTISNGARRDFTMGEIVNLMSVDAQRFVDLMAYLNMLWSAPLQIVLALFFLWQILGPSVLAGLAVMIILIPVNGWVASKIKSLQFKQMKNKDSRVKLMNEILSGIKVLKLYAWEPSFEKQVLFIRNKEIKVLKEQAYLNAGTSFIWACAPFLVSLVTFAVYVLSSEKNVLDAKTAFVSLSLFNILRFPLSMLPMMISNLVQTSVSVKRINKFLNSEDLNSGDVTHENRPEALVIENGTFSWEGTKGSPTLHNISLKVNPGALVAVVGPVGSGKSSLISAFLGEMYKLSGVVNTRGNIAYVPQQAWIQNATLRDNITFGEGVNNLYYDQVLEACALKPDLEILPAGDLTEIGEKGINLSGGQKQRISLARAVYYGADVYFLDDPLSAVDSHVGKHIFEHVIGPNGLLKKKTRVLVTHSVTYLSQVDFIVVVKDGSISESGSFQQLLDKKGDFSEFLVTYLKESSETDEEDLDKLKEILGEKKVTGEQLVRQKSRSSESDSVSSFSRQRSATSDEGSLRKRTSAKENAVGQKLIEVERAETGNVKWKVYAYYLGSVGVFLTVSTIFMNFLFQGFSIASNMWLSKWSSDMNATTAEGTQDTDKRNMYLSVYALLGLSQAVIKFFFGLSIYLGAIKASLFLHNNLLSHILRWPVGIFDITPIGRIVNRFGYDIDVIDNVIIRNVEMVLNHIGTVISTLFIISYSTPIFVTVILPVGALYYFVQRFYVATSRQLKRLESVSRSPIYSHFGETVAGAQSIRAYGRQEKFIKQSEEKVDFNQKSYYPNIVSNRWLSVRLETVGNIIIFFAALFAVLGRDTLSPGLVGLSVSYALQITQTLNWLVRMTSEVETNIVAVERIKEYGETPQEAAWQVHNESVPNDWPTKGDIAFQDFKVRYREGLDLVLKGITFFVNGGEKVGIVGRTGAGKSSLTLSLFRIIESAGGKILIDNIDIGTLGLHTVRSRLTIIPQDPVLFSGSLRVNLDPVGAYSDEAIWRALELAHLKSYIASLAVGLQYEVTEGGENFSVGQRQLICLARALLRKTKVLILDEATAAVDLETDDLIQTTIRNEFKDCTVLTIAHRLNTIMDYDKIIVLDKGYIVEYDSPQALLKSKTSVFYGMAADAGLL